MQPCYHLTKLGCDDVVLLEQDELTGGSTWHAAGLCTQFNSSYNLMRLLRYSVGLYAGLEAETGQAVDWHGCGSVRLAMTTDPSTASPAPARRACSTSSARTPSRPSPGGSLSRRCVRREAGSSAT
jgi:glycine/D-amino acid oxidase-like deaminating enzyme